MKKAIVTHRESKAPLSEQELRIIALITNLEYCSVFLKHIHQSPRDSTPPLSMYIYISNALSSLYESLKIFDAIKKDIILLIQDKNMPDEVAEAWNYLNSKETNRFKGKTLANIRNKITYHVDLLSIRKYYEIAGRGDLPPLWEHNDEDEFHWHSPIAQEIIKVSLGTYFFEENDHIERILTTYSKLSFLTLSISTLWVGERFQKE